MSVTSPTESRPTESRPTESRPTEARPGAAPEAPPGRPSATISVRAIAALVADDCGVPLGLLMSTSRIDRCVQPRWIVMWLARTLTPASLPEIGRRLGGRDHTTVLHGVRRVDALRRHDPALAGRLARLTARIDAAEAAMRAELDDQVDKRVRAAVASQCAARGFDLPGQALLPAVRAYVAARRLRDSVLHTRAEPKARRDLDRAAEALVTAYRRIEGGPAA